MSRFLRFLLPFLCFFVGQLWLAVGVGPARTPGVGILTGYLQAVATWMLPILVLVIAGLGFVALRGLRPAARAGWIVAMVAASLLPFVLNGPRRVVVSSPPTMIEFVEMRKAGDETRLGEWLARLDRLEVGRLARGTPVGACAASVIRAFEPLRLISAESVDCALFGLMTVSVLDPGSHRDPDEHRCRMRLFLKMAYLLDRDGIRCTDPQQQDAMRAGRPALCRLFETETGTGLRQCAGSP